MDWLWLGNSSVMIQGEGNVVYARGRGHVPVAVVQALLPLTYCRGVLVRKTSKMLELH